MSHEEIKNLPSGIFSVELKTPIPWVDEDSISHTKILDSSSEFMKKINTLCPTQCYTIEQDKIMIQHEGCIECGPYSKEPDWKHPMKEV
jgi:electron transfer flavoprotein-quinone oxidoreductase